LGAVEEFDGAEVEFGVEAGQLLFGVVGGGVVVFFLAFGVVVKVGSFSIQELPQHVEYCEFKFFLFWRWWS
jgi:hypothetical protein